MDTSADARDADVGDGECASDEDECTLRAAVQEANATSGPDTIRLQAETYPMLILPSDEDAAQNGDFDVTDDLTILGKGARQTEVTANGLERVFDVIGEGTELKAKALTLSDGHVGQEGEGEGGGARVGAGATLSLFAAAVVDNIVFTHGRGGGIFNDGGSVVLVDTLVARNVARGPGGGIFSDGSVTLRNVTLSGNISHSVGGGILVLGDAMLVNATVTGNTSDYDDFGFEEGGGGAAEAGGTLTFSNSILAENIDVGDGASDCSGTLSSEGYNLVGVADGCDIVPTVGDQLGSSAAPLDPRLGPLANNGGPTGTHALLPESPALDSGNPAPLGSAGACRELDQRGVPRNLGDVCDGGAYEYVLCRERVVNRVGTSGADRLNGTGRADGILALGGRDVVKGRGAGDGLCGGPGRDELEGESGPDHLDGGGGNDLCDGGPGRDTAIACERRLSIP